MVVAPAQPHHAASASAIAPERLAHDTALTEQQKLSEASRQFEAILLRQILSETQKTVIHSKFSDNSTSAGIYRDMITSQLADSMSQSGAFGLAKTFERQLSHQAAVKPDAKQLASSSPNSLSAPATPVPKTRPHGAEALCNRPAPSSAARQPLRELKHNGAPAAKTNASSHGATALLAKPASPALQAEEKAPLRSWRASPTPTVSKLSNRAPRETSAHRLALPTPRAAADSPSNYH